ncbi:hypothetical protein LINGRAHAP2_LOCUS22617 [Linum grandiflorum]
MHQRFTVVDQIQEMTRRVWELEFIQVYSESNHAVDYLAGIGHEMSFGIWYFPILYHILSYWCRYNIPDVSENKLIVRCFLIINKD